MKHDMTDKPTRLALVHRYLDGDTTLEEERMLAAHYRTTPAVDEDEHEAAALLLALDGMALSSTKAAPSAKAVDEFDRLISTHSHTVCRPARRPHIRLLVGCAAAAAIVALGFFVAHPDDSDTATDTPLQTVAVVTPSAPSPTSTTKNTPTPESALPATETPRRQVTTKRKHNISTDTSVKPTRSGIDLARVLKTVPDPYANISIERKGDAFWVCSAADDGTVSTYIIDTSNTSDLAVYTLTDNGRPTTTEYNGGEGADVHGPSL